MSDPYKVLGVTHSASDDQVKTAYRDLARKYHPDNYEGNPLADLASEKMKEINEAYDQVMQQRKNGGFSSGSGSASSYYNTGRSSYNGQSANYGGYRQESSQFLDIRKLINAKRIAEAEELLDGVLLRDRDAEWYFLKGSVQFSRGWLEQAYDNFTKAVQLNPENAEYRAALNQLEWQRRTGRPSYGGYKTNPNMASCNSCDVCSSLICADCCCECMGFDLIPCC